MSLFALAPSRGPRWQLGLQAAIGMAVPVAVMTALGYPTLGYIAGSGAFTVLFLGAAPVVERARVLPFVAVGLIVSAALGAFAAPSIVLVSIGIVVVSLIAAALLFGFRFGPPGPVFFVLVFGLSAQVVSHAAIAPLVYTAAIAAGCAFSYLIALSPLLIRRVRSHPPRPVCELLPAPAFDDASRLLLLRVAIVAVLGVRGIRRSASAHIRSENSERIGGGILTAHWRLIGVTVTWC